ncbi:branched-chain amino acid ABC transporter permease [Vreelandella titanicae]|uniref:High-affinity branched-chain amino acid transport system permease protein LivH n=1 Tax=Vreelandella titanicae TaxID=664683 RepID=A0AAP9NRC0_9GAMM|nr:branched-chain amino acid ABC transporter permease [Halomonas titanicae]QKS26756.1 High-affinity branched-chain amino acid transport system permease protein LivH [Halomonas titanicae]
MDFFLQMVLSGLSVGAVYSLIALGLNLTFWTTRVLNFGQGSVLMIAAMLTAVMIGAGLPMLLALLISMAVAGTVLIITEIVAIRPLLKVKGSMGWVVSTLGVGIFLQGLASITFGTQAVAFPNVLFSSSASVEIFGAWVSLQYIAVFVISIMIVGLMELFLRYSTWGYGVRAVAHDPDLASLMGIPVRKVVLYSFFFSGLLAGIAGILVSQISGTVDPGFGLHLLILAFITAVVGGMGSASGALIAGLTLGVLEKLIAGYYSPAAAQIVAFALLVVVLTVRPQGLLGKKEMVKV